MKKFHLVKFTIEFYAWLISSSAAVRRSSARGPKSKKFTPKFLENGLANCHHFCTLDRAQRADEVSGILVSYLLGLGGGVPPKMTFPYLKNWTNDFQILFHRSKPRPIRWKLVKKNLGVPIDFLTFWGFEKFRGAFSPIFGGPPPKCLTRQKTFRNGIWWCQNKGATSPSLGMGRPQKIIFDPQFYEIGSSKVSTTLHSDRCLDVVCNSWKKFGGRSICFWDTGGGTSKFWGVSIVPNFLLRGATNRKYLLSAENIMQVCIKRPLYTLALFVIVFELLGGRTCKFFNENFWFRLFAFLTNFRRIDFRINLFIDTRSRVLSNLVIIFLIWRPVFEIRGTKKILGPP